MECVHRGAGGSSNRSGELGHTGHIEGTAIKCVHGAESSKRSGELMHSGHTGHLQSINCRSLLGR